MQSKQVTTGSLIEFLQYGGAYLRNNPKERSKLTLALQKLTTKYKKVLEDYQKAMTEAREDLQAEHCFKDKDGMFVETSVEVQGQVIFRKKFNKDTEAKVKTGVDKADEEAKKKLIDFEPHIVEVPKKIDISWLPFFNGFVFEAMTEEEEEAWYLSQKEEEEKSK